MANSSEIGRFGILRLVKRHEPDTTVAFFPIDDEEVTIGRSKQCSVRLYYDCVSEIHCTLQISEQRKAFLLVQGTNGLLVDGSQVNPSTFGSSPTTVPLMNGSEIEIYKKRFKFEYPPKEIRAALLATPRHGKSRRSLRMSMIRMAQVITPQSSPNKMSHSLRRGNIKDNIEWEALRSPVKVSTNNNETQEMMLLEGQGDDAVIVEEGRDLIIIEQVDERFDEPEVNDTGRSVTFSTPKTTPPPKSVHDVQNPPHTPPTVRRRSAPSLHRAVVLRLAQRALERERYEEEQEEDEVEAVVSPERELGPLELSSDEDEHDDEEEHEEQDQPVIPSTTSSQSPGGQLGVIRAGLDVVKKALPQSFTWKAPEDVPIPSEETDEEEDQEQHDEDDLVDTVQAQTPVRRNLGPFMTPQIMLNRPAQRVPVGMKVRASISGEGAPQTTFGGAQRVRTVSPWKMQDIVLPEPEKPHVEEKQKVKNRITEEERQAIMMRRKLALQTPNPLPMPGPRGSTLSPRRSDIYTPGEDKDEDAETMLENMKQKMAYLRRQSEARKMRLSIASPHKGQDFSLLGTRRGSRLFPDARIEEEPPSQTGRVAMNDNKVVDTSSLSVAEDHHGNEGHNKLTKHTPTCAASGSTTSLTPRFDGVREILHKPRLEPKTPSFAGFKMMFQDRTEKPYKTPSFRGVRDMFNRPSANTVLATPQLNLDMLFTSEKDEMDNKDEQKSDDPIMLHDNDSSDVATIKPEVDEPVSLDLAPASKTIRRPRKLAPSRHGTANEKGIDAVNIPSALAEDYTDEGDAGRDLEPKPATTRRNTKRSANKTKTPAAGHSRTTREGVSNVAAGGSKDTALPKGRRAREVVEESDEDSELVVSGEGERVTNNRPVSDDSDEAEVEVKDLTSRRTKAVKSSDVEEVPVSKARRGRPAKIQQPEVSPMEAPVANITKLTRHVKTYDCPDNGDIPPTAKPKAKRGAKAKVTKTTDEDRPAEPDEQSSEPEEVTPAPSKGRGAKKRKAPVSQDGLSDEKENAVDRKGKSTGNKTTMRGRRTPVAASAEDLDAPAKRTRSRK